MKIIRFELKVEVQEGSNVETESRCIDWCEGASDLQFVLNVALLSLEALKAAKER